MPDRTGFRLWKKSAQIFQLFLLISEILLLKIGVIKWDNGYIHSATASLTRSPPLCATSGLSSISHVAETDSRAIVYCQLSL